MVPIIATLFILLIAEFIAVLWLIGCVTRWYDKFEAATMRAMVAENQLERWLEEQQAKAKWLSGYRIRRPQ